jgi:hypothetical protein
MDILYRAAATDADFEQILSLQRSNLYTIISRDVQDKEGFVFAEHNIEILKTMAAHLPQTIAVANDRVIGYTLAMTSFMTHHLPSLTPMFEQFDKCLYKDQPLLNIPFIVGGQVCVAEGYRGMGLVSGLYNALANRVKGKYKLCVTEIARRNPRSLKAHQKMGFEVIRTYPAQNEIWDVVAWDMVD